MAVGTGPKRPVAKTEDGENGSTLDNDDHDDDDELLAFSAADLVIPDHYQNNDGYIRPPVAMSIGIPSSLGTPFATPQMPTPIVHPASMMMPPPMPGMPHPMVMPPPPMNMPMPPHMWPSMPPGMVPMPPPGLQIGSPTTTMSPAPDRASVGSSSPAPAPVPALSPPDVPSSEAKKKTAVKEVDNVQEQQLSTKTSKASLSTASELEEQPGKKLSRRQLKKLERKALKEEYKEARSEFGPIGGIKLRPTNQETATATPRKASNTQTKKDRPEPTIGENVEPSTETTPVDAPVHTDNVQPEKVFEKLEERPESKPRKKAKAEVKQSPPPSQPVALAKEEIHTEIKATAKEAPSVQPTKVKSPGPRIEPKPESKPENEPLPSDGLSVEEMSARIEQWQQEIISSVKMVESHCKKFAADLEAGQNLWGDSHTSEPVSAQDLATKKKSETVPSPELIDYSTFQKIINSNADTIDDLPDLIGCLETSPQLAIDVDELSSLVIDVEDVSLSSIDDIDTILDDFYGSWNESKLESTEPFDVDKLISGSSYPRLMEPELLKALDDDKSTLVGQRNPKMTIKEATKLMGMMKQQEYHLKHAISDVSAKNNELLAHFYTTDTWS